MNCFMLLQHIAFCCFIYDTNSLSSHVDGSFYKQNGGDYIAAVSSLRNGLLYLQKQVKNINLDGAIGSRMVEGQLEVMLHNIPHLTHRVRNDLRELKKLAGDVSNAAIPYIKASQARYYEKIGALIQPRKWNLFSKSREINWQLMTLSHATEETMKESQSDACLALLFGTSANSSQTCVISPHCQDLMTRPGNIKYSLSHQLFFWQIAQMQMCVPNENISAAQLDAFSATFCANMMRDALTIEQLGFPWKSRDLFMEIQALCGMMGYRQFAQPQWLENIVKWQKETGCWGLPLAASRSGFKSRGIDKREERQLSRDCLSHRTAVAVAALVQHVRFALERTSFM